MNMENVIWPLWPHLKFGTLLTYNLVVDALSRKYEQVRTYAISVAIPDWLDEIQGEYAKDPDTCALINDHNKVQNSNGGMTSFGIKEKST